MPGVSAGGHVEAQVHNSAAAPDGMFNAVHSRCWGTGSHCAFWFVQLRTQKSAMLTLNMQPCMQGLQPCTS